MTSFAPLLTLLASFVGLWAFVKYVVLVEIRVDANVYKTLYDFFKEDSKFIVQEEFTTETRHPVQFAMFCFSKKAPWFYLSHGERLMQAGWQSKDQITVISCARWQYGRFKQFLSKDLKEISLTTMGVPVQAIAPFFTDKVGSLKKKAPEPVVARDLWEDIDREVGEVVSGKRNKTGALLYGPPGNGKTSLVKYLATKYNLPIMVFTLDPQWSNHDLLALFGSIPPKCIFLMEDFDNYYDNRKCLLGGSNGNGQMVRFTFDVILNGLDGVYNTYDGVVFIMTVNHIDKVDPALRCRPSRFKYVKQYGNPSLEVRENLLKDGWAEKTEHLNLDQIFRLKEYQEEGDDFAKAMSRLQMEFKKSVSEKAMEIYTNRLAAGLPGTPEDDWAEAEKQLGITSA